MAKEIKGARFVLKRSNDVGVVPTVPPNNDHTSGWIDTDIYVGELFLNVNDGKMWFRDTNNDMIGLTPLNSGGTIDPSYLPDTQIGAMVYMGLWDASTGNPPTPTPEKGYYYIVNVAGNTDLDGITDWKIGDFAIYNGTRWDKIDNTEPEMTANNVLYDHSYYTSLSNVENGLDFLLDRVNIYFGFEDTIGNDLTVKGRYSNNSNGGNVTISGGTSNSNNGGDILLIPGNGTENGGNVYINSGYGGISNGKIYITGNTILDGDLSISGNLTSNNSITTTSLNFVTTSNRILADGLSMRFYYGGIERLNIKDELTITGNLITTGTLQVNGMVSGTTTNVVYYNTSTSGFTYDTISGGSGISSVISSTTNQLTVANGTTTPEISIVTGSVVNSGTALATGDQIYDFVIGLGYSTTDGTVSNVSSSTTNQLTVANETTTPALSIVTGAVSNGETALATGDQIYDFVIGLDYITMDEADSDYAYKNGTGTEDFATDNLTVANDLTVIGKIISVETEHVKSENDLIITRYLATTGLIPGTYTGIQATKYDGTNDGQLVFGSDGFARVGDISDLQILATREDSPISNGIAYFDTTTKQFKTKAENTLSVSNADTVDSYHASAFPRKSENANITGDWSIEGEINLNGSVIDSIGYSGDIGEVLISDGDNVYWAGGTGSDVDADKLDGYHGSSYLRSDANDSTSGVLTVNNQLIVNRTLGDAVYSYGGYSISSGNGKGLRFSNTDNYKIYVSTDSDSTWGGYLVNDTDTHMYFTMGGGTNRGFVWKNDHGVIGQLSSDGNFYTKGEQTAYSTSDERFKNNITDIQNGLKIVNELRPVNFEWNDLMKSKNSIKVGNDSGLIAQEVEKIIPEVVHNIYDDYKSIDYAKLTPYLISAIKELNIRINKQQEQLDTLK